MKSKHILLASSSRERKRLLSMLNTPFECANPDIDETPFPNEHPTDLAYRLSLAKAKALETKDGIIIAGDQIISVDNTVLGKPLNHANAVKQLQLCSQQKAISYTGVCILSSQNNFCHIEVIETHIQYRTLNDSLITAYLQHDKPYECAGSIRLEGRGHLLINGLSSSDPYAIYGLPLFSVTQALTALGFDLCDFLEKPCL